MRRAVALVRSAHAAPTCAVTAFAFAVAVAAGGATVLVPVTVLFGQLSIGWSNDVIDLERDRASGRADKPLVRRDVSPEMVWTAARAALALSIVAGFAIGLLAGVANAVAVAAGWAYNVRLKATVLSVAAYAVHFAVVPPLLVTLSLPEPRGAPVRLVFASALLGASAHFVNVIPDVGADREQGVAGLPQRIGARWSAVASAALLLVATALLLGVPWRASAPLLSLLGVALSVGYGVAVAGPRPMRDRRAFALNMLATAVVVGSFVTSGGRALGAR